MRPSWVNMEVSTRRASADWTTFVRSRQSMQLIISPDSGFDSLCTKRPALLADEVGLEGPEVAHGVKVEIVDQLGDVFPFHPMALCVKVECFVRDVGSIEEFHYLAKAVGQNCFFACLLG